MSFQYQLENGKYSWNGHESEEVAVVYDDDPIGGLVLLKHGSPQQVELWWQEARKKYIELELGSFFRYMRLVQGKLDVDELNKSISCSGYRPTFLEAA